MPSTMAYRQGDIVLVSFPFTDLTSSKRRPALILSPDSFNAAGEDLVPTRRDIASVRSASFGGRTSTWSAGPSGGVPSTRRQGTSTGRR